MENFITENMIELANTFFANGCKLLPEADRPALNAYLDARSTAFESACGLLSDDGSNNAWMDVWSETAWGRFDQYAVHFVSGRISADAIMGEIADALAA